jgi:eukaryotic-like serine/threonine-protein kinase
VAAVGILLLGGWGWSVLQGAASLREERDRAQAAAERALIEQGRAESATTFLVELFRSADPAGGERGDTLTARTLLTRGASRIREDQEIDPAVGARLLLALGEVALALGMFAEADAWSDDGIVLASRAHGPASAELASLLHARARFLNRHRNFGQAAATARQALEIRRGLSDVPADSLAASLHVLSVALGELGETAEARAAAREAEALHTAAGTEGSPGHVAALGQLAYVARRPCHGKAADTWFDCW